LAREQQRIDLQITETLELIEVRKNGVVELRRLRGELESKRSALAKDLDFMVKSFVSENAEAIATTAAERATTRERIHRYEDYIELFNRFDRLARDTEQLEEQKREIESALAAAESAISGAEEKIAFLEQSISDILGRFRVSQFGDEISVRIDRETLLPVINGRTFDSLISQGLNVLVNIAHALAYHRTALKFGLRLPGFLIIDGPSNNIGHEGLDLERVQAIYDYLVHVSEQAGERLQIIVADNDVPENVRKFVRLRLTDDERLIPVPALAGEPEPEDVGQPEA
jgi:hypothetical protein